MKKILLVVVIIIFITLLLPLAIVWLIGGSGEGQSPIESGTVSVYVSEELICTHILPKKTKATLPKATTVR